MSGLRKHGKEPFLFLFFLPILLCWVLSLVWSHYMRSSCMSHDQWNWTPDKNAMAEPGAALCAQKSSSTALSWFQCGAVGGGHVAMWLPPVARAAPCGTVQRVSLHDPLNLARGWCQLASLYTSFQTVLATRLSRTTPKSNKTKQRVDEHESVWRRLIWTWMEGKLVAGQNCWFILIQIFMLRRHAFLTDGSKQGYLALQFSGDLIFSFHRNFGKKPQNSVTLKELQRWTNGPIQLQSSEKRDTVFYC